VHEDFRQDRIGSALRGENPTVLARLPGSFAVMGDVQWLPGYCVLLVDRPGVSSLTDLPRPERLQFLSSMELLGQAVEDACREVVPGYRRLNLEILGNTDDFLHAHVWPRYRWEPPELVGKPVWLYPGDHWTREEHRLGPEHDVLRRAITRRLEVAAQPR
jgi:diadenosine tetraphosphate (Ap4A) HIT family hydrolase